jgi:hypothetical protein
VSRSRDSFLRVTRGKPCPVCQKPDWCLVARDGSAAVCTRVESPKRIGKEEHAGWLHVLRFDRQRSPQQFTLSTPEPHPGERIDWAQMTADFTAALTADALSSLSVSLGVSVDSLRRLSVGWCARKWAYSFPMSDTRGKPIGIRLRSQCGFKFAVKGSKQGLFLPDLTGSEPLLVAEGPSDCAALLDWGFDAVGRPSCTGGVRLLVDLVKARRPRQMAVVADNDAPGQAGAERLTNILAAYVPMVRMVTPPAKDAREWQRSGVTRCDVLSAIEAAPIRRLQITVSAGRNP